MRVLSSVALIVGVLLIPSAVGLAKVNRDHEVSQLERMLVAETGAHGGALESYFGRARSVVLLTANSPAFANVLAQPGTRRQKVRRRGRNITEVIGQLGYLERLYPSSIGEACFIDADGAEIARVVRGEIASPDELSTEEERTPFFAPTFALNFGQTHQTRPYVSPDTREWVVANATLIPQKDGRKRAIVHFEVTIESFRRAMGRGRDYELRVIDGRTGRVVIDGQRRQRVGAALGVSEDRSFVELTRRAGNAGVTEIAGRKVAYARIRSTAGNANDWIVVASANAPLGGFIAGMGVAPLVMLTLALALIALSGVSLRAGRHELEAQASTDALTGLGNRRKLLSDLERRVSTAGPAEAAVLTMFDLNGFKNYNDTFGHPAGDALLLRLGSALAQAVVPFDGCAYRQGGDEFCVIAAAPRRHAMEQAASRALSESGEGFAISTAFGSVVMPQETGDPTEAMRKADAAMYAQKHSGRATAGRQSTDVLLRVLAERIPELGEHLEGVTELVGRVATQLNIEGEELIQLHHAAALHDIGKIAIPTAILIKPSKLNDDEWAFMRRHTLIGERIIAAAPALSGAAPLVRSSHEAFDGSGYPDGLAGVEIPLGARIIAVCDAFDAMISNRPYSPSKLPGQALAELRRCAGTQFDPAIVQAFEQITTDHAQPPSAGTLA
jgi:diguanylate cyclase (GGDEF)-like protein